MAYTITHLLGRARLWGAEDWDRRTPACQTFQAFAAELQKVFGQGYSQDAAAGDLLTLRQGQRSVMDFSVEFYILARRSGWPPEPLTNAFLQGLADHIRDLLVAYPRPATLDRAISPTTEVDKRLQSH